MRAVLVGRLLSGVLMTACDSPTTVEELKPCPQTYEFGNFGCARVVVMVEAPNGELPEIQAWDVRVIPRRTNTAASANWSYAPGAGAHLIPLTRWYDHADDREVDTLSVTVKAALSIGIRSGDVILPAELVATDSAVHVMRFVPVGSTPSVDTVYLRLKRVE